MEFDFYTRQHVFLRRVIDNAITLLEVNEPGKARELLSNALKRDEEAYCEPLYSKGCRCEFTGESGDGCIESFE